jgi:hypothetical protein
MLNIQYIYLSNWFFNLWFGERFKNNWPRIVSPHLDQDGRLKTTMNMLVGVAKDRFFLDKHCVDIFLFFIHSRYDIVTNLQ